MRFINLHTGNVFDGSKPYIHWFEGQQSTGIIYTQPICFISNVSRVPISIPNSPGNESSPFMLIDPGLLSRDTTDTINEFDYKTLSHITTMSYISNGVYVGPSQFIHIIYVIASAADGGEYIGEINIGPTGERIVVGADFYQENESLKINASNLGINIPDQVQRAIYDSNVHEEKKDNILINRKFKELLSNYWDMMANRGSYKSLINTLKWFEYGDLIRLREIWKHDDFGCTVYDDRELKSILSNKYKSTLDSFFKTTYFAIYLALQKETGEFTDELNPELTENVFKWSINDMSIKMSLLGNFYETYFMPIHTELIHSTIEDIVFTNTIKINNRSLDSWSDLMNCTKPFKCIVNNGEEVTIEDVSVGVDDSTVFGVRYEEGTEYDDVIPIGVEPIENIDNIKNDVELKTLLSQNYNGPGSIVPLNCIFELSDNEVITYGDIIVTSTDDFGNTYNSYVSDFDIYNKTKNFYEKNTGGPVKINFNILLVHTSNIIDLHFISSKGNHFSKSINISVKDISNVALGLYKVKRQKYQSEQINMVVNNNLTTVSCDLLDEKYFNSPSNYYSLSRIKPDWNGTYNYYKQYLPGVMSIKYKDGVGLNQVIAVDMNSFEPSTTSDSKSYALNYEFEYKMIGENAKRGGNWADENYSVASFDGDTDIAVDCLNKDIDRKKIEYQRVYIELSKDFIKNMQVGYTIHFGMHMIMDNFDNEIGLLPDKTLLHVRFMNNKNTEYIKLADSIISRDIQSSDSDNSYVDLSMKITESAKKILDAACALEEDEVGPVWIGLRIDIDPKGLYDIPYAPQVRNSGYYWKNFVVRAADFVTVQDSKLNYFKDLQKMYFMTTKGDNYTVFISKFFTDDVPVKLFMNMINNCWTNLKQHIYFSREGFFPEFHFLEPYGSFSEKNTTLSDFTINQYDTLCVIPVINIPSKDSNGTLITVTYSYGKDIINTQNEKPSWEFHNRSTGDVYIIDDSILEPYILPTEEEPLGDGYYDITFRYKLKDSDEYKHELFLNSAFRKITV